MQYHLRWRRIGVALVGALTVTTTLGLPAANAGDPPPPDPPVADIEPLADSEFSGGEEFAFVAAETSNGTLAWTIERLSGISIVETIEGGGGSINLTVPESLDDMPVGSQVVIEDTTTYRITLTATVGELEDTEVLTLTPDLAPLNITSDIATEVQLDVELVPLPLNRQLVVGFERELDAPAVACIGGDRWVFARWSNDKTSTSITVSPGQAGVTLEVVYTNQGPVDDCQPVTNPADVYRAINLNGPAIVVDGLAFETGRNASNLNAGPNQTCARGARPNGATAEQRELLKCFVWGGPNETGGPTKVTVTAAPAGVYDVYIWTFEDNFNQTYNLVLNGTRVAEGLRTGNRNAWKRIGPYRTVVEADGLLGMRAVGGDINFSAIELRRPECNGEPVTHVVTPGQALTTTAGDDVILGTEGDDVINSGEGDDLICALDGNDRVDSGAGDDLVFAGKGNDTVNGADGDDRVRGAAGDDTIYGGNNADNLLAGPGNDQVFANKGDDVVKGGGGNDTLNGNGGGDVLSGAKGDDNMRGGAGDDRLNGGVGTDTCDGGGGANVLTSCNP
jgi:Ca2+-binding RTX toxin-like protein